MPDRYGEDDQPVVDFDSRRQAREAAAAVERAEQQRQRLAETRTVHAPLSGDQSKSARTHRNDVTSRAESTGRGYSETLPPRSPYGGRRAVIGQAAAISG